MKTLQKLFRSKYAVHLFLGLAALNFATAVTSSLPFITIWGLIVTGVCGWCAFDANRRITTFNDIRSKIPDFVPDEVVTQMLKEIPKGSKFGGVILQDEDGNRIKMPPKDSKRYHATGLERRKLRGAKTKNIRLLKRVCKRDELDAIKRSQL